MTITRAAPAGLETYNPVVVDGRYTQHTTSLYGQFQKAIGWTAEDMAAQYGELATEGFTGARVADALAVDGIDVAVIYGPEYDLWLDGIDPELQAAMVRAYNRCRRCGRPRGYIRKFGICRICFRQLALNGDIPGIVKASW